MILRLWRRLLWRLWPVKSDDHEDQIIVELNRERHFPKDPRR